MKKAIFTILIMLMMASNAFADCGVFTSDIVALGAAWSTETYEASYEEITDVSSYASTAGLGGTWTIEEVGAPECEQTYGQGFGDFNKAYETMFDSPIPDYQKTFFNENTNVITTVAAFNGNPGSVSVVSINSDTYATIFKNNYEWDGDAITFTGATYDSSNGRTTISANTQYEGADVQIIFAIDGVGDEVYTTQIEIDGHNIISGCIELINEVLVTCTEVDDYAGATTINKNTGQVISTVVIPVAVKPSSPVKPHDTIGIPYYEQPEADAGDDILILQKFSIALNGAITPTTSKYASLDATWDSVTGIEILSADVTAVYGITNDGLTSYPTVSVYNTLTNTQIFGYRIQNENAVIAGVTVTDDGDIVVAATDAAAEETSVYLFNSAGVLQDSGKMRDFSAYTIDVFTVKQTEKVIIIGGKNIAGNPKLVEMDLASFEATEQTQAITASYDEVNAFGLEAAVITMKGSFGIQIYGITANPDVPEFSLTTLLLAALLAGGLVLFVVRRKYK